MSGRHSVFIDKGSHTNAQLSGQLKRSVNCSAAADCYATPNKRRYGLNLALHQATIKKEIVMQVNSVFQTTTATPINKGGNNLPPSKTEKAVEPQKTTPLRDLAQTIDPTNMSRNEARAMANALMKSGDADLSSVFFSHSVVSIPTGNGTFRNPTESDPIMNEKFNMFDAIRGNIEFNKSKGLSNENNLSALSFLEKFEIMGGSPKIDTHA